MTKVVVGGFGIVGQKSYSKEVPTVQMYPNMTIEGVIITIPLRAYARLANWASVSRTFDGILDNCTWNEDTSDSLKELQDIQQALSDCHEAIRSHWSKIKREDT